MENEKLTKDQLEIRKIENEKKNWEALLAQAIKINDTERIEYFRNRVEDCDKNIQNLKDKTSLDPYRALAPKKQEVAVINPATPTQKVQSKGKLNKLKVALAALGVAGIGIIAFLAGSKIQKDKDNANDLAKSLDDNETKNEQESVQKESTTEIEKVVDETIASQDKQNEIEETKEQEEAKAKAEAEAKAKKKAEEKAKAEAEAKAKAEDELAKKEINSNSNSSSNSAGVDEKTFNEVVSNLEKEGIKPRSIETFVEVNDKQEVISTNTKETGGELKSETSEEVKSNPNEDAKAKEAEEKAKAEAEAKAKAEKEAKAKAEAEAKAKKEAEEKAKAEEAAKANESNKINETEEVIEDNVVLPPLSDEELAALEAEVNALINSQVVGDGFVNPNEEVVENSNGMHR